MKATASTLTAAPEKHVDYMVAAQLGTDAFDDRNIVLTPAKLKWFYESAFSSGFTVVALLHENKKVGQIAMVRQTLMINGKQQATAQLVDLYIKKSFRGKSALIALYDEVERQFRAQNIRIAFGMPNAKAVSVNEYFFQLKAYLFLDVRVGLAWPMFRRAPVRTLLFSAERKEEVTKLGDEFATPYDENGLSWNGEKLYNRLCSENRHYALHATENLMLVSSPRKKRGIEFTLLCGFLIKQGRTATAKEMRSVINWASATWKRPLFIFAGHNAKLPILPGLPLSRLIHKSPMVLQLRDFAPDQGEFKLTRFQLMDFDFA
jgi:Acetyltransferase (GNAT) domain